jgi:nitric oxide reductase large subunit
MIRGSFLHLALGFLIGATILWQKGPGGLPGAWRWLPVHIHMLLIGWIAQLAMGVAYWILPRFAQKGDKGDNRRRPLLAWAAFLLLNSSTVAALTSQLPWTWGTWGLPASGILAALAALAFVLHAWPRVKPFII